MKSAMPSRSHCGAHIRRVESAQPDDRLTDHFELSIDRSTVSLGWRASSIIDLNGGGHTRRYPIGTKSDACRLVANFFDCQDTSSTTWLAT
jgi:hypothetical protein